MLLASEGLDNDDIAARLNTRREVVSKWRKRFFEEGLAGLEARPRRGRPARFSPRLAVEIKAIACELPALLRLPLARFHVPDIRAEVLRRGLVAAISDATIWRWLAADAVAPWRHRSWIFPRDPDFEVKAARVLDLYAGRLEGRRLRRGEYVVSADEKTSIQARRRHPTLQPAPGRIMRVEHEYDRGGALQYLAAWDVHRAKLFGRCEPATGIEPFGRLVAQVMSQPPVCHCQARLLDRRQRLVSPWAGLGRPPRGAPIATCASSDLPVHASWLNQIEIYFSIIQRKVLTPNDFADLDAVEHRLLAFQEHYEQLATPFEWKFTRADLSRLLVRLEPSTLVGVAA